MLKVRLTARLSSDYTDQMKTLQSPNSKEHPKPIDIHEKYWWDCSSTCSLWAFSATNLWRLCVQAIWVLHAVLCSSKSLLSWVSLDEDFSRAETWCNNRRLDRSTEIFPGTETILQGTKRLSEYANIIPIITEHYSTV